MHSDIDSTNVKHPFIGGIRQADNSTVGSTEDEITNQLHLSQTSLKHKSKRPEIPT